MIFAAKVVPAFGVSLIVIPQPCGCWSIRSVIGMFELDLTEGHWCRDKGAISEMETMRPDQVSRAMLDRLGIPVTRGMQDVLNELRNVSLMPECPERVAAMAALLESYLPQNGAMLTPVLRGTEERLNLRVVWLEGEVRRGPGVYGIVRDIATGQHYRIEGKPCSLTNEDGSGCYCDAWAYPIEPPTSNPEGTK